MVVVVVNISVTFVSFVSLAGIRSCRSHMSSWGALSQTRMNFSLFQSPLTVRNRREKLEIASGQFHVTDITFRGHFFGNKTFFNKLIFYSFCLKFVLIFLTWYFIISRKETWISFKKAVNIFVLNSVTDITKKSTYNFTCSCWHCYSCESTCQT